MVVARGGFDPWNWIGGNGKIDWGDNAADKISLQAATNLEEVQTESASAQQKDAIHGFCTNSGKNEVDVHYLEYKNK